jgi:Protein of unknown function (DUF2971)
VRATGSALPPDDDTSETVIARRHASLNAMRKKKLSEAEKEKAGRVFGEVWYRFFPSLSKRYRHYPRGVSHYTTAAGLLGICRTNALWATCAQYSNDHSEARYGAEIAKRLFDNLDSYERSALGVSLSFVVGRPLFAPPRIREWGSLDAFTVSFCKSKDLLSQWRGYGSKLGFEIRFSGMAVGNASGSKKTVSLQSDAMLTGVWAKIEYDPKVQQNMISETMSRIADARRELEKDSYFKIFHSPMLMHLALLEIARWVHSVKHPKFEEEQEWRIISFLNSSPMAPLSTRAAGMEFREGQHGVMPYVELRPSDGKLLPIAEVVCGPGADEYLTPKAVEFLFARYGFSNFKVTTSEVPLRPL